MLLTFLGSFGDDGGLRPDKEVMELGEGHRTRKKKGKRKLESRPGCYQALGSAG